MLIGYARVSTTGQNLDSQIAALNAEGIAQLFQEKVTGAERNRPQLDKLLQSVSPGDIIVVTSLDRLARSTHDLFSITQTLEAKEAALRSLREPWADTASPMGKFLLTVFAGLAELERAIINDRATAGRASAKERGVQFGRRPKLTPHQRREVLAMLGEGKRTREIARHFNVGVANISRIKSHRKVMEGETTQGR
ncbi:recombinase family protein [Acetobacteraceae bacterium]|nr:recombinase family protein [Candidatus Parcubacteria bacterium]